MDDYAVSHLGYDALKSGARRAARHESGGTARLLVFLGEIDAQRFYVPAGYSSMHAWCVGELNLCEHAAYKRITAARYARDFPELLPAVADGRLHLTAVILIGIHMTKDNQRELIGAATRKSCPEIRKVLAEMFPRQDVPLFIQPASPAVRVSNELAPERVVAGTDDQAEVASETSASFPEPHPADAGSPIGERLAMLRVALPQRALDKLQYIRELASHEVPSGDPAELVERAFDAYIEKLEKRRFAATDRPRVTPTEPQVEARNGRHIPNAVKRAVWARDGGRCAFVSRSGKRCDARCFLTFHHVDPYALGGPPTVENIELRCSTHNRYEAELVFGVPFIASRLALARGRARRGVGDGNGSAKGRLGPHAGADERDHQENGGAEGQDPARP